MTPTPISNLAPPLTEGGSNASQSVQPEGLFSSRPVSHVPLGEQALEFIEQSAPNDSSPLGMRQMVQLGHGIDPNYRAELQDQSQLMDDSTPIAEEIELMYSPEPPYVGAEGEYCDEEEMEEEKWPVIGAEVDILSEAFLHEFMQSLPSKDPIEQSEADWKKEIDLSRPPFESHEEFITYCTEKKLSETERGMLTEIISEKGGDIKEEMKVFYAKCRDGDASALRVYTLYYLQPTTQPFSAVSRYINKTKKLKNADKKISAKEIEKLFFDDPSPKELYSLAQLFGNQYHRPLRELSQLILTEGDRARDAIYWYIRTLDKTNRHIINICKRLNDKSWYPEEIKTKEPYKPVPCPFGNRWRTKDVATVLSFAPEVTVSELFERYAKSNGQDPDALKVLCCKIKGNDNNLKKFIKCLTKFDNSRSYIAEFLGRTVDIPGYPENRKWAAHMIAQVEKGDLITLEKPPGYIGGRRKGSVKSLKKPIVLSKKRQRVNLAIVRDKKQTTGGGIGSSTAVRKTVRLKRLTIELNRIPVSTHLQKARQSSEEKAIIGDKRPAKLPQETLVMPKKRKIAERVIVSGNK